MQKGKNIELCIHHFLYNPLLLWDRFWALVINGYMIETENYIISQLT